MPRPFRRSTVEISGFSYPANIAARRCPANISNCIRCIGFPCKDVDTSAYMVPGIDLDPAGIKVLMITEAPPRNPADYYYSAGMPFYLQTTVQAFRAAGCKVNGMQDILDLGIYITTAVKCGKMGYGIAPATIKTCALLLGQEVGLFPSVKAYLLGGDVAIKAMNGVWAGQGGGRVVPSGPTYKIRSGKYFFRGARVFPSYTPAGKNILIEKSKLRMVAEDIAGALKLAQ